MQIQVNYQGQKIFTKASKLYPGVIFTFYFKSIQADEKFPHGIEFYECANCAQSGKGLIKKKTSRLDKNLKFS